MTTTYLAERCDGRVVLRRTQDDGRAIVMEIIPIDASLKINAYDTKFEMGFAGTGPQQLACAILLDAFTVVGAPDPRSIAKDFCHEFMMDRLSAAKVAIDSLLESIELKDIIQWHTNKICGK